MEEFEQKLKELIIERYGSVKAFANQIGIAYTTMDSILKRGIQNCTVSNLIKISNALDINAGKLAEGIIYHNAKTYSSYNLEVFHGINTVEKGLEHQTIAAHFDGDGFTEEELEEIRQFAEFVKNRKKNKE